MTSSAVLQTGPAIVGQPTGKSLVPLTFAIPGGTGRLVAHFPELPPGGDQLVLEGGIIWEYAHRKDPGVTALRVGVEDAATGEVVADLVVPPGLEGMQKSERPARPEGYPQGLSLFVESANPSMRHACVELTVRRRASEPPMREAP